MIDSPTFSGCDQSAYAVAPHISDVWPQLLQYVVVVPYARYRPQLRIGDYVLVGAPYAEVTRVARVVGTGGHTRLVDVHGENVSDAPFALVIGSHARLASG